MKLDEAIEILEKQRREHHSFSTDILGQAEALGIEALKFRQAEEKRTPYLAYAPLPGETEGVTNDTA